MRLTTKPAEPTGYRWRRGIVCTEDGCRFRKRIAHSYDRTDGHRLRDARKQARLNLGAAAQLLGLGIAELSSLEHGRLVFTDIAMLDHALRLLVTCAVPSEPDDV